MADTRTAAREAHRRRDWQAARDGLVAAAATGELSADDAFTLADATWWLGDVEGSLAAAEQAYRRYLDGDRPERAAMAAIHIAVDLLLRGDEVVGGGWLQRAQRLLADRPESAEHGYLTYLTEVEARLGGPALDEVIASAARIAELGRRYGDRNLVALGMLGQGRALVKQARVEEGLGLLDEAMVAVLTEDLAPEWAGNIYCHLMSACHELGDVRRAVAWTRATTSWLETLPAAVLFTGICRVHRSQVFQASGSWDDAEVEAAKVCADLEGIHVASAAEAHYQVAELRRLRGDLAGAELAYEEARARGRDPHPGLALLQLAGGRVDVAAAAIATAVASVDDPLARVRLRAAQVEIALAVGDRDLAEEACAEVTDLADRYESDGFVTLQRSTRGACLLARGRPEEALPALRSAARAWRDLGVPYEAARVGLLTARACEALGDHDGARRERDAAREVFERLGATGAAVEAAAGAGAGDAEVVTDPRDRARTEAGLTRRELDVLTVVASGCTNREVAERLVISEKTVARHLSNIFVKLGCSSRTAASAYAHERGLVPRSRG
jgi:DNA-binding CsgD family transcriptional regulator